MKGITTITHNGSKFFGQPNDPIEMLFERLRHYKLTSFSTFERFPKNGSIRRYWGNFEELSAAFSVDVRIGTSADKMLGKLFRSNWQKFRTTP